MIGINKITFSFPDFKWPSRPEKWEGNITVFDENEINNYFVYRCPLYKAVQIRCTYYPNQVSSLPRLVIYISSASRLIYGNNFTSFPDLNSLVQNLQKKIQLDPKIPLFQDLINAQLADIEFYCHYFVGQENMEQYLNQVAKARYPNRNRIIYCNEKKFGNSLMDSNGTVFKSKHVQTRFYDKYLQSGDIRTKGYLRHDIQITSNDTIGEIMKIDHPTCQNLTEEFVESRFNNDLKELRLSEPFENLNHAEEILKNKFEKKTGSHLADILNYMENHPNLSIEQMAEDRGIGRGQFVKLIKMITEAGISPILHSNEHLLPPLSQLRSLIP